MAVRALTRALRAPAVAGLVACALLSSGCSPDGGAQAAGTSASPAPAPVPATVVFGMSPGGKLGGVQGLTVAVAHGTLTAVTLTDNTTGLPVQVDKPDDGPWHGPTDLPPDHQMSLTVAATSTQGTPVTATRDFNSGTASRSLKADVEPFGKAVVGVGEPIVVRFNHPVPEEAKAQVQRSLMVTTTRDAGPGSWAWFGDSAVHYRPKDFWPAHTDVTVHVRLQDEHLGSHLWGRGDRDVTFSVGRSQILKIDDATYSMQVVRDGAVVRTVPISLGKPEYPTRSGIKVIMTKEPTHRMDSTTAGITGVEAYDLTVQFAMRMTYSGEFIHAAPWNTQLGKADLSHGCTNVGLADAQWLFDNSLLGDPVVTTGTGRPMTSTNGLGDWNLSWSQWQAKSAL